MHIVVMGFCNIVSFILFFCLFQAGIEIAKLFLNEGKTVEQFIEITFMNYSFFVTMCIYLFMFSISPVQTVISTVICILPFFPLIISSRLLKIVSYFVIFLWWTMETLMIDNGPKCSQTCILICRKAYQWFGVALENIIPKTFKVKFSCHSR